MEYINKTKDEEVEPVFRNKPLLKIFEAFTLFILTACLALYIFRYMALLLLDDEGSFFIVMCMILGFICIGIPTIFLAYSNLIRKVLPKLSKKARSILLIVATINMFYSGFSYFLSKYPGDPMFFRAKITAQQKYHLGDLNNRIMFTIEPERGSVYFHDIYLKNLELHKPDGTIVESTKSLYDVSIFSVGSGNNCHVILFTTICTPSAGWNYTFQKQDGVWFEFDQAGIYTLKTNEPWITDQVVTLEVTSDKN